MTLSVAYDETYSDVYKMNELDDEALALLEETERAIKPRADCKQRFTLKYRECLWV